MMTSYQLPAQLRGIAPRAYWRSPYGIGGLAEATESRTVGLHATSDEHHEAMLEAIPVPLRKRFAEGMTSGKYASAVVTHTIVVLHAEYGSILCTRSVPICWYGDDEHRDDIVAMTAQMLAGMQREVIATWVLAMCTAVQALTGLGVDMSGVDVSQWPDEVRRYPLATDWIEREYQRHAGGLN